MRVALNSLVTDKPVALGIPVGIGIWKCWFCGDRKTREPGEKPLEQRREPRTNSTHIQHWVWEPNRATLAGGKHSHYHAIPAPPYITVNMESLRTRVSINFKVDCWFGKSNRLLNFVYEVYKVNFVVVVQMLCIIHSCLRLEEWVLTIYMMLGGSQTSTPTLSKFNQALFHPFFCSTCMQLFQARLSLGSVKLKVTMLKGTYYSQLWPCGHPAIMDKI